jgi:hypothetical protein
VSVSAGEGASVFKRLFGKPDEELSGLSMGRFMESQAPGGVAPAEASEPFQLPSRKPPPNIQDLVLPETLAQEATHPRDVDVRSVLNPQAVNPPATPGELTDAQIEAIAQRVADKLAAGIVGDRLREAVTRIVSETSERLVREEIARIHAAAARPPTRP